MVECPNCGKEIGDDNFCGECGTKIEKKNLCPNCDNEIDESNVFCPKCGEKLKETEEETPDETEEIEEEPEEKQKESEEETTEAEEEPEEEQKEAPDETEKKDSKNDKKTLKHCPYCNSELENDDEFCQECGKPTNVDKQSFEGIKLTIQPKKLIIFSIIAIILSFILSVIFSLLFGMIGKELYPIGIFISLLISIAIFASFKDYLNGGLLGIITGLVIGLLSPFIVELSSGFVFSYNMFSGYAPIIFTIFGALIGIISSKALRNTVKNYIDVEKLF